MILGRESMLTGRLHILDLPVTIEQLALYASGKVLLQDAFPHLSPAEREFIKTGISPEEWEETFGPGPDDDTTFDDEAFE